MKAINLIIFVITLLASYLTSKYFDDKYEIKKKLYNKFKDSTGGIWLIILGDFIIISAVVVVVFEIDLKSEYFYTKIIHLFAILISIYFLDYHKIKKAEKQENSID